MKLAFLLAVGAIALAAAQDKPIVETENGKVSGDTTTSRGGRMYYQFKGIPYAKAERFQNPTKPDKWTDVKDATKFGDRCGQYDVFIKQTVGSDDCLHLNVYTPQMPKEGEHKVHLPVMVWINPKIGASDIVNPKYLMDQDVLIVTFNHRTGPLGFLNTGDMYAQGNQGMKDQVLALKWVKDNIEKFGGDKARVTIFGSSAGAAHVLYHIYSPMSKGLFHNAIAQSGSPTSPFSFIRKPIHEAKKFGEVTGCPTDTSANLVMCLKQKDIKDLFEKYSKFDPRKLDFDSLAKFGPSIETKLEGQTDDDLFLTDTPYTLLTEGKVSSKVPLIMGNNNKDGLILPSMLILNSTESLEMLDKEWNKYAPGMLNFDKTAKDPAAFAEKVRKLYLGDKPINEETRGEVLKMFTDRYFFAPNRWVGKVYSKQAPTYLYLIDRKPEYSIMNHLGLPTKGLAHLDENQYLWKFDKKASDIQTGKKEIYPEITKEHKEYMFSDGLVKLWTSFAETGKPTKLFGDGKEWKKNEFSEKQKWLKMTDTTKLIDEATLEGTPEIEEIQKRMDFWTKAIGEDLSPEVEKPALEKF